MISAEQVIVIALVGAAVLYLARNAWLKLARRRSSGPKPACGAECGCGPAPGSRGQSTRSR